MTFVCNAGPVIALAKIDRFSSIIGGSTGINCLIGLLLFLPNLVA